MSKRHRLLGKLVPFELSLVTYMALAEQCKRLGIDPNVDAVVTDAGEDAIAADARYRAFIRKTGWGIRFGRHSATVQEAVESLLLKITPPADRGRALAQRHREAVRA